MTLQEIAEIIGRVTYKPGWTVLMGMDGERPFLQIDVSKETEASMDSHLRDGTRTPWKSGKRYLSLHMCKQEVVGQIFDLIKSAEMHEVHEWFRYRGASIYNPHLDPDVLVEIAKRKASLVTRDNAMTMVEGGLSDSAWVEAQGYKQSAASNEVHP